MIGLLTRCITDAGRMTQCAEKDICQRCTLYDIPYKCTPCACLYRVFRSASVMHRERKNIVLFVFSCRNENILIIRCHPNSLKNTHRRGAPCGRPVAFQRRITLYYCRSYSPIGHPQGAPLRWMCSVCKFDFLHERHEWRDLSYMNNIVLFVYSCRNENILIIRCHPNSLKNTHRRGVPRGRPVAFQRRITLYYCRSYSPIGHPQGAPLRWVYLGNIIFGRASCPPAMADVGDSANSKGRHRSTDYIRHRKRP